MDESIVAVGPGPWLDGLCEFITAETGVPVKRVVQHAQLRMKDIRLLVVDAATFEGKGLVLCRQQIPTLAAVNLEKPELCASYLGAGATDAVPTNFDPNLLRWQLGRLLGVSAPDPRRQCNIPALIAVGNESSAATCSWLSRGELVLRTRTPAEPGTLVVVQLELGGSTFSVYARVSSQTPAANPADEGTITVRTLALLPAAAGALDTLVGETPPAPPLSSLGDKSGTPAPKEKKELPGLGDMLGSRRTTIMIAMLGLFVIGGIVAHVVTGTKKGAPNPYSERVDFSEMAYIDATSAKGGGGRFMARVTPAFEALPPAQQEAELEKIRERIRLRGFTRAMILDPKGDKILATVNDARGR